MTHASVQLQMLAPAVTGTTNVLRAASAAGVQRVVVVSSIVAVEINPKDWPEGEIRDESCWSDRNLCMKNEVSNIDSVSLNIGKIGVLLPLLYSEDQVSPSILFYLL